jgi:hypothetical protein
MNNMVVRLAMVLFLVVAVFAMITKSPAKRSAAGTNTVGVKIETTDPNTGVVTTETTGITIVHDRGARLNFVPAQRGTNVGVGK